MRTAAERPIGDRHRCRNVHSREMRRPPFHAAQSPDSLALNDMSHSGYGQVRRQVKGYLEKQSKGCVNGKAKGQTKGQVMGQLNEQTRGRVKQHLKGQ